MVVLYGSRAKGNFTPGSDIDLTIIESGLSLHDLLRIENQLDDLLLPYTIDLSLYRLLDHPGLVEHIRRVGIPFYMRSSTAGEEKLARLMSSETDHSVNPVHSVAK